MRTRIDLPDGWYVPVGYEWSDTLLAVVGGKFILGYKDRSDQLISFCESVSCEEQDVKESLACLLKKNLSAMLGWYRPYWPTSTSSPKPDSYIFWHPIYLPEQPDGWENEYEVNL